MQMKAAETGGLLIWRAFPVRSDTSATPSPLMETDHRRPELDAQEASRREETQGEDRSCPGFCRGQVRDLGPQKKEPRCPLWRQASKEEQEVEGVNALAFLCRSAGSQEAELFFRTPPKQDFSFHQVSVFKKFHSGLPWWSSGKRTHVPGAGDRALTTSPGKIPHALEQPSPRATTTQRLCSGAHAPLKAHRNGSLGAAGERAHRTLSNEEEPTPQRRPSAAKRRMNRQTQVPQPK